MLTLAATATLAAATASNGHHDRDALFGWLILAALVCTLGYLAACWIWPFGNCRRCHGTGRRRSPSGRAFRALPPLRRRRRPTPRRPPPHQLRSAPSTTAAPSPERRPRHDASPRHPGRRSAKASAAAAPAPAAPRAPASTPAAGAATPANRNPPHTRVRCREGTPAVSQHDTATGYAVDCDTCHLFGQPTPTADAAGQLAAIHDDIHHYGAPYRHRPPRLRGEPTMPNFYDPEGVRHGGTPTYPYRQAPAGLLTVRQLRAEGLRPGGQEIAAQILWRKGKRVAYLYRAELAKPKRTATPAQRAAIAKALLARRTCPECGQVREYFIPRRQASASTASTARWPDEHHDQRS